MTTSRSLNVRTLRDGHQVRIKWGHIIVMSLIHLVALAAPFYFSWYGLGLLLLFAWICGGLGITLCYHRLLTHRSYQTPKWVEYTLTIFGMLAMQGGPLSWVGTHRIHHAESDGPLDPHSPRDGFGWAHVFWMMYTDHPNEDPKDFAKDLARDPVLVFFEKTWYLFQLVLIGVFFAGGYLVGGLNEAIAWVLWGVFLRIVVMYHGTWFVNSAAHTWGYRNFETADASRNSWWVALISFGEGWHNNHHAQQRSAAHGMKWWEFDITYLTIRVMEKLGFAWKVVRPKLPETKESEERPGALDVLTRSPSPQQ